MVSLISQSYFWFSSVHFPQHLLKLAFQFLYLSQLILLSSLRMMLTVIWIIVLNRLKDQLNARGASTIRGLGRTFRIMDNYDGNRKVDAQEFFTGLQEFGVRITKAEADVSNRIPFSNSSYLLQWVNGKFRLWCHTSTLIRTALSTLTNSSWDSE
jgi:hypothetical protein